MAKDDRDRAEASDSDRMRFRLACSAEAWSARADLLERLEFNRTQIETEVSKHGPVPDDDANPDGATQ